MPEDDELENVMIIEFVFFLRMRSNVGITISGSRVIKCLRARFKSLHAILLAHYLTFVANRAWQESVKRGGMVHMRVGGHVRLSSRLMCHISVIFGADKCHGWMIEYVKVRMPYWWCAPDLWKQDFRSISFYGFFLFEFWVIRCQKLSRLWTPYARVICLPGNL